MKNMIKLGAALIAAALIAVLYMPINAKAAAAAPQVSFTSAWYDVNGLTFVLMNNKGTLGTGVNGYTWNIYEKASDCDTGISVLDYTETRTAITDPIYVNTSKFRVNAKTLVTIVASCPTLGYSYTVSFTVLNDKSVNDDFSIVASASGVLHNGAANKTLDGYLNPLGDLARATVNAFTPAGYMTACEGAIAFDYKRDYSNKNGIVCYNIPEGVRGTNRTFKLMTLGDGGVVTVCDDLDVNPATISAAVNFNGYAVVLIYTEGAAPAPATAINNTPAGNTGSGASVGQLYAPLTNCGFVETTQGAQCTAIFNAFRPFGYTAVRTYSIYTNGSASVSPKNGIVTMPVPAGYTSYKLVTVDGVGNVQILDDIDTYPAYATFLLNFNGYAIQLVAA